MNRISAEIVESVGLNEFEVPDGEEWELVRTDPNEPPKSVFVGDKPYTRKPKPAPGTTAGKKVPYRKKGGGTGMRAVFDPKWTATTAAAKFSRVKHMARRYEDMESRFRDMMRDPSLTKEKAIGTAALLMIKTGMRIGGGSSPGKPGKSKGKSTFGLTTLQRRHVEINGSTIEINYLGKSAVPQHRTVRDKELADSIKEFMGGRTSAPTSRKPLFSFNGKVLSSHHVIKTMKEFNDEYKNHDARTHMAAIAASEAAEKIINDHAKNIVINQVRGVAPKPMTAIELKRKAVAVRNAIGDAVAAAIGDTRATALKAYTNPEAIEFVLNELDLPLV